MNYNKRDLIELYKKRIVRRVSAKALFFLMVLTVCLGGCKKFLNVDALDSLSGNNFWQNKEDVERYTIGVYSNMRTALLSNWMVAAAGDWRCGPWTPWSGAPGGSRTFITLASQNAVKPIIAPGAIFAGSNSTYWGFPTMLNIAWESLYKAVAAANILYEKVDEVEDPSFSAADRSRYKAEAVYLRSLAYFYLVRYFGDVPYYTKAYNADPLPKTSHVEIFNNCIKELGAVTADLPWTYSDPANVAVRAMRGGALILMMEMNMWAAGFDQTHQTQYWTATDSLGSYLINKNEGAYFLVPIDNYPIIFRGKSKEGLVELSQNANYGETGLGFDGRNYNIEGYASHTPPGSPTTSSNGSYSYISTKYMQKLYPEGQPDKRRDLWFGQPYAGDQSFELYKYYDFKQAQNGTYPIGSLMILRYADAYLLRAEALNDLGRDAEAVELVNVIRARAGALDLEQSSSTGSRLGDAIWYERCREFLGEGNTYFDLVRTRRVMDARYAPSPMGVEAFYQGAWTWPIPQEARDNNPLLSLSGYWSDK